jgi:hypothetical protein
MTPTPEWDGPTDPSCLVLPVAAPGSLRTSLPVSRPATRRTPPSSRRARSRRGGTGQQWRAPIGSLPGQMALVELVAPRSGGVAGQSRVTPARRVPFLRRSMGGVRPGLRPGRPSAPRAGLPAQHGPDCGPRGRHSPAPGGRNALRWGAAPDGTGRREAARGNRAATVSQSHPWTSSPHRERSG